MQQEAPRGPAGPGPGRRAAAVAAAALGVALVGLRAGWTAGAEAFVVEVFGAELARWSPEEARALARAWAPGLTSAADGTPTRAAAAGWLLTLGAAAFGALVLARSIGALAQGTRRPGPGLRSACAAAAVLAVGPWTLDFVARRTPLGAEAYLDLGDLAFGLGTGLLVAALLLWRRGRPSTPDPEPGAPLPGVRLPGVRLPLACAALLAALGPLVLSSAYLDREPLTNDGVAYRWQAELFADGRLEAPSTPADAAFGARQVLPPPGLVDLTLPDGPGSPESDRAAAPTWSGWTAKYPPGHAALLAPGAALGAPRLLPLALAGLCVLLTFHLAWRLCAASGPADRRRLALGAAWCLAASPMVLGVEALWLSHGTSLPAGLLFALAWLVAWGRATGDEPGSPWLPALVAGAAASVCLAARPLTAVALAIPLAMWTFQDMARFVVPRRATRLDADPDAGDCAKPLGPRWLVLRRPMVMLAALAAAVPGIVAFGLVNAAITGDVLRPVYDLYATLLSPNDRWGLANAGTVLEYTVYNLSRLSPWLLGGPPALLVLVLGWWSLARRDEDGRPYLPRLRAGAAPLALTWQVPATFVVLYAFHRFQGIPWVGPLYLVEALPFLAVPAAAGVLLLARAAAVPGTARLFAPVALSGLALLHPHLALAGERVAERTAPARAAATWLADHGAAADGRLLVLVPIDTPAREKQLPLPPPAFTVDPTRGTLAPPRWPVLARDPGPGRADLWELLGRPPVRRWDHASGRLERLPGLGE